jgi:WD40 repeat protein
MEYHAFISYSHAADTLRARALQSGLQRLAKPWFRLPVLKVFRDETSLSANPGLWSELERNLASSGNLILFASRLAAQSEWVSREVDWWLGHRSVETLFLVVTDGELHWDEAAKDFDWTRTTCLPKTLQCRFAEAPLYVDLTWATAADLSLRHTRFRASVLRLAAPLHGRPMDELDSEDIRENRRLRRATWTALLVITCLAIVAAFAALQASRNADRARKNAEQAARNALTAEARRDAAVAELDLRDGKLADAVGAALRAHRTENSPESRSALFQTFEASWDVHAVLRLHQSPVRALAFRKEGRELLTWSADNTLVAWDVFLRRPLLDPLHAKPTDVRAAAFSPTGDVLATGDAEGRVVLWDAESLRPLRTMVRSGGVASAVTALAFDHAAQFLAVGYENEGEISVFDVRTGETARVRLNRDPTLSQEGATSGLSFSSDNRYLAAANNNPSASVAVWDMKTGALAAGLMPSSSFWMNETVGFVPSLSNEAPDRLAIGTSQGDVSLFEEVRPPKWLLPSGDPNTRVERFRRFSSNLLHHGRVSCLTVGPDALASAGTDGRISVWLSLDGSPVSPVSWTTLPVTALAFSGDREYLASGAADGTVVVYYGRIAHGRFLEDLAPRDAVEIPSPDGSWIVRGRKGAISSESSYALVDAKTARIILRDLSGDVEFSADSHSLLVTTSSWDMHVWKLLQQAPFVESILARKAINPKFSASGNLLIGGFDDLHLWDLAHSPVLDHVLAHGSATDRGFSPDGKVVLVQMDRSLHVFDAARATELLTPIPLERLKSDDKYVFDFSPNSQWLLTGSEEEGVSLHAIHSPPDALPFPIAKFFSAGFSPNSRWLALLANSMSVWQLPAFTRLLEVPSVHALEFSKDSRWLAFLTNSGSLSLWDLSNTTQLKMPVVAPAKTLTFSPDSRSLFLGNEGDESATQLDLSTLEPHVAPFSLGPGFAFSSNGEWLATARDRSILLVKVAESRIVATLEGHVKPPVALAFSEDGNILASVDTDGSAILWDPARRRGLSELLQGPGEDEDTEHHVDFEQGGRILRVDQTQLPTEPHRWIADICRRTDPALTLDEWHHAMGTLPYPWQCKDIRGVTRAELSTQSSF